MSSPRVLHLCNTTDRRGAEVFASTLAEGLSNVGVPSNVMALQEGTSSERLPIRFAGRRGRTPLAVARVRAEAGRHDVVVGHGASTLWAGALATAGTRVAFVYRFIGDPGFWSDVRFRSLRITTPLRRARAVVTLWREAASVAQGLHGIPEERVRVIPNGRDPDRFRPPTTAEREAARRALGLEREGPVAAYIGSLSWEKQPLLAAEAALAVPGLTLVVAGDGPLRGDLEDLARATSDRVVVLGSVADARSVLWAADTLVLTSRTEGMPGVVIEAGLCGLPSVAPDVGGTRDLVSDATGKLLPPGPDPAEVARALAEVLGDTAHRGEAARARCLDGFTLAESTARWADLLRSL